MALVGAVEVKLIAWAIGGTSIETEPFGANVTQADTVSPYGEPKLAPREVMEPCGAVIGTSIGLVPVLVTVSTPSEVTALTLPAAWAHAACSLRI